MKPIVPSLPHSARRRSGPGRAARRDARVHGATVGEHRRHADHCILEEAVARARLAGGAHRDDPAERRRQHDRRVITDRQAARREDALELEPGQAGLRVDEQRVLVELQHLIEAPAREEGALLIAATSAAGGHPNRPGAPRPCACRRGGSPRRPRRRSRGVTRQLPASSSSTCSLPIALTSAVNRLIGARLGIESHLARG